MDYETVTDATQVSHFLDRPRGCNHNHVVLTGDRRDLADFVLLRASRAPIC
jgi:hypothetical protein